MCLWLSSYHRKVPKDRNIPREVLKLRPDTEVAFWKVYRKTPSGKLRSPYHPTLSPITRDGYQISSRCSDYMRELSKIEIHHRIIDEGIHVFTDKLVARRFQSRGSGRGRYPSSLLTVLAKRADILAYDIKGKQAVCSKIYVPSADKTKKARHG
jgi:hypothetical protein